MRLRLHLFAAILGSGLLACKKDPAASPVPGQHAPDTGAIAPTEPMLTRGDTLKSMSESLREVEHQDTTSVRISIARIDSSLAAYDGGDTLHDTVTGSNECIGEDLREIQLKNGLLLSGSTYSIHAQDWVFSGNFTPILGLRPGMDSSEVIRLLGKPRVRSKNAFRYVSEPPEGREADLFEALWTLDLVFEHGKLKIATFIPSMDDC
ncbi:MAG: hypothetical protein RL318_2 [Fibrobacterota bacterium]|jgi:hypothetical protein